MRGHSMAWHFFLSNTQWHVLVYWNDIKNTTFFCNISPLGSTSNHTHFIDKYYESNVKNVFDNLEPITYSIWELIMSFSFCLNGHKINSANQRGVLYQSYGLNIHMPFSSSIFIYYMRWYILNLGIWISKTKVISQNVSFVAHFSPSLKHICPRKPK